MFQQKVLAMHHFDTPGVLRISSSVMAGVQGNWLAERASKVGILFTV